MDRTSVPQMKGQPPRDEYFPSARLSFERKLARLAAACNHFTIFKFTTNYKVLLFTSSDDDIHLSYRLGRIPGFATLEEAVDWALRHVETDEAMRDHGRASGDERLV